MESVHELKHPLLATSPGKGPLQAGMAGPTTAPDPSGPPSSRHMPPTFAWLQPGSAALAHQLLDPSNLHRTVEPYQTPESVLHPELWKASALQGWKKKDYIETAFGDSKEAGELPRKVGLEKDIRTVCYEVGDTELPDLENDSSTDSDTESESSFSTLLPQDYLGLAVFSMLCCFWPLGIAAFYLSQKTNKASAKGDYPEAWTASRQTFALAVLSIILGICTYIGAVVALITYLSNKAPT